MTRAPFGFAGTQVAPGTSARVELPAGRLPSGTSLTMPAHVLHGVEAGPVVWMSGALHGDEIVGVEIIRRMLEHLDPKTLAGTVIAVPVVNVFGFISQSRYLPDRRDLNRSFPGSPRGSLASRVAHRFLTEVVEVSDIGLDFHAGSDDRTNLPQIRGNMDDSETRRLATAFGSALLIHSRPISGTLREAALRRGKKILLFEGGEPRRFSPRAVDEGTVGAARVLGELGMIDDAPPPATTPPRMSRTTRWVRAPRGGIFRLEVRLGNLVEKGQRLGVIADPAAKGGHNVVARMSGMVLGHAVNPLVHQGEGLVHIAELIEPAVD